MSKFKFYLPRNETNVRGAENPYLTGTLTDQRSHFIIKLAVTFGAKFTSALVTIAKQNATTNETAVSFPVLIGDTVVIQVPPVGTPASGKLEVPFVDNTRYTIKLTANAKDGYGDEQQYFAEYITIGDVTVPSYSFLYRADGGDKFKTEEVAIVNESSVEGAVGSNIVLRCPINRVNVNDTTIPRDLIFTFDATDNSESVSYSKKLPYNASGDYTLEQTTNNKLYNDKAYKISVIAIYNDGYYTSINFPKVLHVIATPVIHSITAYGLTTDQSDADALGISSVMNVLMNNQTGQTNLPPKSGKITFELSQVVNAIRVVMYNAVMNISTVVSSEGKILYTILKEDLVKVWTTTAPTQEINGSYKYDVSAKIEHSTVYALVTIFKQSAALNKTFTSDIMPLPSVVALNAWIAGANVAGAGDRMVDVSNTTTANGYALAPELGIVGKFYKNDFYGSGITGGFFKDLDAVDANGNALTNHTFTVSVGVGAPVLPVTVLHQIQGYGTKTDQEMYIELFESVNNGASLKKYSNINGLFPNLPGPANTLGSVQKPIYFLIPSTDLFVQTNSVKVSIAIEPPAGETTRPAATNSTPVVAVPKVNKYVMTVGTASEPRVTTSTLIVPINNPTASEPNFASAIFTSDLASPNALKEVSVSNNGVFDIVVDTTFRGDCNYQVRYKISDPNAENGSITGPISANYTFKLTDPPNFTNFSVDNFSYKTFNNDGESSFKFDVAFVTVESRSIDGVIVYFQSTTNDEITLMDVKKSDGTPLPSPNQDVIKLTNVSYTLQKNAPAAYATLEEGVNIMYKNSEGNDAVSANKWLNFRSGKIVYKPYQLVAGQKVITPDVTKEIPIFNIPKNIPMPTNLTLTGGVKESYTATSAAWADALSTYASIGSSVTANYKLTLNDSDVSGDVNTNNGYTIDLSSVAADTLQTLKLQTRITASDSTIYLSDTAELKFTVASVDVTGLTSTVKRGSNDTVLRVSRGDYAIIPASGANVTEVKLIDNGGVVSTNPEAATVKVLTCTSTTAAVQPVGPTVNEYDLAADGYAFGDDLDLQYRLKAGVNYTTKYGVAASPSTTSSPLFLTLASQTLKYIVATKPDLQLESTYRVMSSGAYSGRIAINATINAKGLQAEGVVSVVFVLAQEGNFTTDDLSSGSGVQYVISFETTSVSTHSYAVGSNAVSESSTDNLGANEVHELSVTDVAGLAEGGAGARTLVMGNLLANDASTLYLDASGFDTSRPITAVSVVGTRLGNDIVFKELTRSA